MANNQKRDSSIPRRNSQRSQSQSGKNNGTGQRSRQNSLSQHQEPTTTTPTPTSSISPPEKRQRKTQLPPLSILQNQQSRPFTPVTLSATTPTYAAVAATAAKSASSPASPATPYVQSKRYSPGLPRINILNINSPSYSSQPASARPRLGLGAIPEAPEDGLHQSGQNAPPRSASFARRASRSSRRRHSDSRVQRVGDKHYYLQGYLAQTGPFSPGSIIRVPHFEQYSVTYCPSDWKNRLETEGMGAICSKWRRMVVVTEHRGHHVCLPIHTFNGRGVEGQYRDPDEYVPIRDHRLQGRDFDDVLTIPAPVIKTRFFKDDVHPLHESSVIALTYPISRRNDCTAVFEGKLRGSSTRLLMRLYVRQMVKSIAEAGTLFAGGQDEREKFRKLELFVQEFASCEVLD